MRRWLFVLMPLALACMPSAELRLSEPDAPSVETTKVPSGPSEPPRAIPPEPTPNQGALADFDDRFLGSWHCDSWGGETVITIVDGELRIESVRADGIAFDVYDVRWEPPAIRATFYFAENDWETHSRLELIDDDHIEDRYDGDGDGVDLWERSE